MEKATIRNTVILFAVVAIASYFGNQIRSTFDNQDKSDEHEIIRKYLLNDMHDSPINQKYHKPKLWVHTKYEANARQWKSFYSRKTTDLNQPYIHLTIKTIIEQCGEQFDIMLIDDDSFSQLLPQWSVQVSRLPEPFKSRTRELGMAQLLYKYGGIRVPNSFICFRNLYGMFEEGTIGGRPFVTERVNSRFCHLEKDRKSLRFVPDSYIMGCRKGDPVMEEYVMFCQDLAKDGHFQDQTKFTGASALWFLNAVENYKINLMMGEYVGVKTTTRKAITLDDLMEETTLDLFPNAYGLYIPEDEILLRNKYQWFASMPSDYLIETNMAVSRYLRDAL
jgi:hypothetical protein